MPTKDEDKWLTNLMQKIHWPEVPDDLHQRSIEYVEESKPKILFYIPIAKLSRWAFIAFSFSFCMGLLQNYPENFETKVLDEAPYYGITSIYIMQSMRSDS